jgi:hypothetical protein
MPSREGPFGHNVRRLAGGPEQASALLLIPGQTESWWGYEKVMPLLDKDLIEVAGQRFEHHSFPEAGHFLHEKIQRSTQPPCVSRVWVERLVDDDRNSFDGGIHCLLMMGEGCDVDDVGRFRT